MFKYNKELLDIQHEYLEMLYDLDSQTIHVDSFVEYSSFVDRFEAFWLSKRLELSHIITDLTTNEKCVFLSGSLYVNTEENLHYDLGTIGERSIIDDPIMKMRPALVGAKDCKLTVNMQQLFSDAIHDTSILLKKYPNSFVVFPVAYYLTNEGDSRMRIGEQLYWAVLSYAVGHSVNSLKELKGLYYTLDKLEKAMGDFSSKYVFTSLEDIQIPMKDRIHNWIEYSNKMVGFSPKDDIDAFFFASMSLVQTASNILYDCLSLGLFPFVRNEVYLNYLLLIADAFKEDKKMRCCIEYSLMGFLLHNYVIQDGVEKIDFNEYRDKCRASNIADLFREAIFKEGQAFSSINIDIAVEEMTKIMGIVLES